MKKKFLAPEKGELFKISAQFSYHELFDLAQGLNPPQQSGKFLKSELVDIEEIAQDIRLDIRYAANNNFMGMALYSSPKAFLQKPAAKALKRVHEKLKKSGYGIIIHDAYRPWYVTKMFWDATPNELKNFVADPSSGSHHNRGCAVDVSLYDVEIGTPLSFGGDYDEFSERSFINYPGGTFEERHNRKILRSAMESEEFIAFEDEWWHYDYYLWKEYPVLNLTFEELAK